MAAVGVNGEFVSLYVVGRHSIGGDGTSATVGGGYVW